MKRVLRNERGIALAVAIFALVVVGALVAGAMFAGTQEQRVGENVRRGQQAFGVAEGGAYEVIRQWDPSAFNSMRWYPQDSFWVASTTAPAGSGSYGGYVYKLNRNLYLIDVTGRDRYSAAGQLRGGGARQRIGLLGRIRPLQIPSNASLTTRGNVTLAGNASVNGADQIPPGWDTCAPADTMKAGVRTSPTGSVTATGNATVEGAPPVVNDPTVTDSTFNVFGDVTYDMLAARANIVLPANPDGYQTIPAVTSGVCDRTVLTNWGDGLNRANPCGSYFPIIHITGSTSSTTLNGVQGQGILLVDGDLRIQGSYEFFGVVIVRGRLSTAGGGTSVAHIWGATMAGNVDLEVNSLSGNATLNYSKCAIIQALEWTGLVALMRSRSWVQLF